MGLKENLHFESPEMPLLNTGEVWWASIGENIGVEINGKSKDFTRPVIIFKKFSSGFYFVIPLTTQIRTGSWYVNYRHQGRAITACLHQARSIDHRRLHTRLGRLDDRDFEKVKDGFKNLYL